MALDPRIALAAVAPDVGQTFNTLLTNIGLQQQQQQQAELQPLRQQLLQAQAQQTQQRVLSDREKSRLTSLGNFAAGVLPSLRSDNPQEALSQAKSRLTRMQQTIADNPGIQLDTTETQEFINLLESGDAQDQLLATERAEQAFQLAQSQGLLGRQAQQTPRQIEFQQLQALPEGTPEERRVKQQFAQLIGAESKRAGVAERLEIAGGLEEIRTVGAGERATITTRNKLIEQTAAIPEQQKVEFLSRNRERFSQDISESQNVLTDIDRAIEIWETAPGTISGPIAGRFPALADDTQELESILARLGVDRLANFKGATSERELATAFRAGASIEQNSVAGLRRLRKQRQDIERNNARLKGLLNESNALLRKQPAQAPQAIRLEDLTIEQLQQLSTEELQRLSGQ